MLINLYMIKDYLSIHTGQHLISDPVLRDLSKPTIFTKEICADDMLYILDPSILGEIDLIPSFAKLFFTAPPPEDSRLEGLNYLYTLSREEPIMVLEEIYEIFRRFNEWDLALNQCMLKEDPVHALGVSSMEYLCNPFGLYTSSFYILRYWEKVIPGLPAMYSPVDRGAYMDDDDVHDLLLSSDFVSTWTTTGPQYYVSARGDGSMCIYQNINLYGKNLARIVVTNYHHDFRESDFPILDYFIHFITKALESDSTPYLTPHPAFLDETMLKLLSEEYVDDAALKTASLSLGWQNTDSFLCARVIAPQDKSIGSIGHACMRLESMFKGCCVLKSGTDIMMIINLRTAGQSRDQVIFSLPYLQREYLMKIGYSYEFRGIRNLSAYYAQAGFALKMGQEYDPHIWTYRFEDYALRYGLQNYLGELDIKTMCHPGLMKLLEYDSSKGRNFANTLRVYLENNMSVSQTIRKVYLQRASFQYQLQKILEITGANLDDFETRLHLILSFHLMDLEKNTD